QPCAPWELRLRLEAGERAGDLVASLEGAVAVRGSFTLGPVDLTLSPGERVSVTGRNGSGKSTLLAMLRGDVRLAAGQRRVGRRTVIGALDQKRDAYGGPGPLLEAFCARCALARGEARTLPANFGPGAGAVGGA